jgi:hypothetical protein
MGTLKIAVSTVDCSLPPDEPCDVTLLVVEICGNSLSKGPLGSQRLAGRTFSPEAEEAATVAWELPG